MENRIYPGKVWLDDKGERIQAHGGGMFIENGKYYWYGEDKSRTFGDDKCWTYGVRCYSSEDLINWHDEGYLLAPDPEHEDSLLYPLRRLDRPHIIKNPGTGKYVCWLKFCDKNHFSVFTADDLLGPYTLVKEVLRPYGHDAGDFDLAVDEETGEGYLYFEADHDSVYGTRLTHDYTDVSGEPVIIYSGLEPPFSREGVVHFLHNGMHYIMTSGMTGYVPNPSEIAVSEDWLGPYKVQGDPHVNDNSSASFNSQASFAFTIPDTDTIVVMADRWVPYYVMTKEKYDVLMRAVASRTDPRYTCTPEERKQLMTMPLMGSANTSVADYVWLPVRFDEDKARIEWKESWSPKEYEGGK